MSLAVIVLYFTIVAELLMILGISNDGLSIVIAIIGVGVVIFLQLKTQTSKFTQTQSEMIIMNCFQKDITLSHIDEKIAVLYGYSLDAKNWKSADGAVATMTDKLVADITAIIRVRNYIGVDQKIKLNEALRHLINSMSSNNYDTGRIEDVSKLLT
jgi:hypothetical protein